MRALGFAIPLLLAISAVSAQTTDATTDAGCWETAEVALFAVETGVPLMRKVGVTFGGGGTTPFSSDGAEFLGRFLAGETEFES